MLSRLQEIRPRLRRCNAEEPSPTQEQFTEKDEPEVNAQTLTDPDDVKRYFLREILDLNKTPEL